MSEQQWPGTRQSGPTRSAPAQQWPGQRVDRQAAPAPVRARSQGGNALRRVLEAVPGVGALSMLARSTPEQRRAAVLGAFDGVTMNFTDEAAGAVGQAMRENLANAVNPISLGAAALRSAFRPDQTAMQTRGQVRDEQNRARRQNPIVYNASAIAGGLLPAVVSGGGTAVVSGGGTAVRAVPAVVRGSKAVQAVTRAAAPVVRAARAAAPAGSTRAAMVAGGRTGAVYGALAGAGDAREGERGRGAARGAVVGALAGGSLPALARGGVETVKFGARVAGRPLTEPSQTAARVLQRSLAPNAEQRLANADELGVQLSNNDLLRNSGRRVLRYAAGKADEAQDIAIDNVEQVRAALPDRGQAIADRLTGNRVNLPEERLRAEQNVRDVDARNYPPLMRERATVTPEILDSLRSPQSFNAIDEAINVAREYGRQDDVAGLQSLQRALNTSNVSKIGGDNGLEVSVSALEDIYRALRDTSRGLQSDPSRAGLGNAVAGRTRQFDAQLQELSPGIANARAASSEARQSVEALDNGYRAFDPKTLPDQVEIDFNQMPQTAQESYRMGAQARLGQNIGQNPFAALRDIGYRPNTFRSLDIMGAPADEMARAAQLEAKRVRNADFISPNTGSQTAPRLGDIDQMPSIPVSPMGLMSKVFEWSMQRGMRLTPEEMTELVRLGVKNADLQELQLLARSNPEQLPQAIQALIGPRGATAGGVISGQLSGRTPQEQSYGPY